MKYTAQDFKSDQQVRWCPGCGDHAVLTSLQRALPKIAETTGTSKEKFVVVSGIGCSSRLPYYMATYGFHGIHGRATALSTGIKVANPSLVVWQACGDGDALAIGGNHFIHAIRRNVDINIVLFNNRIYGLTKGQYSPTSRFGAITKTSPYGTVEPPFEPGTLAIGAGATFFARSIDVMLAVNDQIMNSAAAHKGASIMELLTNCVIFNDGSHREISEPSVREDRTILLEDGKQMIFGANRDKALVLDGMGLKVVSLVANDAYRDAENAGNTRWQDGDGKLYTDADILVHDSHTTDSSIHMMLAAMKGPEFPVALGVIRDVEAPAYDQAVSTQLTQVRDNSKIKCVDDLLRSGSVWEVK